MSEHVMIGVIMISLFASSAFILATIVDAVRATRKERYQADVQSKLIEKLGTGADVMSYAGSDAFKSLLAGNADGRGAYVPRVLNTLQAGVVLLCTGIGMAVVSAFASDARLFLQVAGGIVIALGIGLALSGAWSYLLLRRWGLLVEESK
ncbi:MAG: hypothetical protein LC126_15540 [Bryobacterales bacterium]|nr:hypothetical protein [Bryobacterales bacterium]